MSIRITESQLRGIVRQEILREAGMKGVTMVKGPDGSWVPSGGMSDWEGEGARMAADMRRPRITGMKKFAPDQRHAYTLYLPETQIDGVVEIAELEGCSFADSRPTGENVEDEFLEETVREYSIEIRGTLEQLEKFYYALSEEDGFAQSVEEFDPEELGIHRV